MFFLVLCVDNLHFHGTSKKHYHYSHKGTCPKGGLNRIDAGLVHKLVFDWLKDISASGERFMQLQEQGKVRLQKELALLHKEHENLEDKAEDINSQVEARIRELIKTDSEIVRKTIEQSIEKLREQKREINDKRAYVDCTISDLENLLHDSKDLFKTYGETICEALSEFKSKRSSLKAKAGLQRLFSVLALHPTHIKTGPFRC